MSLRYFLFRDDYMCVTLFVCGFHRRSSCKSCKTQEDARVSTSRFRMYVAGVLCLLFHDIFCMYAG